MTEKNWLPRIVACESAYFLRVEDGLEEEDDDIYLELRDTNGRPHGLRLSPEAYEALNYNLAEALQSPQSPLARKNHGRGH